ncbi:septal ring lytic transglycosylase RlpA family protein [Actinomadura rupiterrae]|uniref:septal ring lytic transglycosylase RlpA family protein n=1 Tax=Actinomadura rupiterrae TaxID=559627 RepID=UPI0020A42AC2|nr:septal ring lytic transglycosylase RlpA family protein [Actinomadura rupiterrae]MCP2340954.1 hypothetical protein [Actinomadura rupiterrae]
MQKRALNIAITALTGSTLAGFLVAGVAMSGDDTPDRGKLTAQQSRAELDLGARKPAEAPKKAEAGAQSAEKKAAVKKAQPKALLAGSTIASYFWDDGSGVNGDTGAPAGGEPMQKGLFASPSWPLGTKVKVSYNGRSVVGFIGDRGPGEPSRSGVMLDLDTYTFRYLLDGGKPASKYETGTDAGHLNGVKWEVLSWGTGAGSRGAPSAM